jgi:hypothetical protein
VLTRFVTQFNVYTCGTIYIFSFLLRHSFSIVLNLYLLTYLLMEQIPYQAANRFSASQEIPPAFYGTRRSLSYLQVPATCHYLYHLQISLGFTSVYKFFPYFLSLSPSVHICIKCYGVCVTWPVLGYSWLQLVTVGTEPRKVNTTLPINYCSSRD